MIGVVGIPCKMLAAGTTRRKPGVPFAAPRLGHFLLSDGTLLMKDNSLKLPDGTIKQDDGSVLYPDGTVQMPDGSMRYPDGVFPPLSPRLTAMTPVPSSFFPHRWFVRGLEAEGQQLEFWNL